MRLINSILSKPYLVFLIALIIALITPDTYFLYSLAIVSIIFIITIIFTITQKKWLRLFLSLLGCFIFFIAWIVFIFIRGFNNDASPSGFSSDLKPEIEIGDNEFYKNEIKKSSNLTIFPELKILSKLDTIEYIGMGGDYRAECLYTGPSKIILDMENKIILQKEFNKVKEIEDNQTEILNDKNFNLMDLKSVYKKESEGYCIIYIAFDKNYSKFYYSAIYY
jgi:energy-coupling factor transporter transmembrane protein EcfT